MKNVILLCLLFLSQAVTSQNLQDALRMSDQSFYSSARSAGVGSAYGSLGADFGSISYNPASVAMYRSNEFNIGFSSNKVESSAILEDGGSDETDRATNRRLKLENFGLVIHDKPDGNLWTTTNFAFGMNRLANFDQKMEYSGLTKGSFTDRFLERANGLEPDNLDNFEAGVAYEVGAIYEPDNQNYYKSDYQLLPNNLLDKAQEVDSRGGIYEMLFAYGASYKDRINFGLSIGVPFLNYNEDKYYVEEAVDDNSYLKSLEYKEFLSVSGVGINFKGGVAAKLSKIFRVGASVHSPTYYTLQDDYTTEMIYGFDAKDGNGLQSYESGSPNGNFKYKFKTPWRYTGSVGAVLKLGEMNLFLDFDAEYADYSTGEFNFTAYSSNIADEENEKDQNQNIGKQLRSSTTYRFGGELAYKKWRGRIGYVLPESPFENSELSDVIPVYTFGLGYRGWDYYIDFAIVNDGFKYGYTPYELVDYELEPFVTVDRYRTKWMLTFGKKF